ncbi:phytanoyl-CoA dioxygenase family protein [Pseudoalteromonas sp. MMG013]|uniref:phytanoyl-CoA dioxygenase family protein n=1 Tax=Pseudoalteromonas sp. MMG013 TaxID=2822687 RepID=UPI001B37767B|nr:phytanoyl-CoA dioxygenase family protein [Pseudoalteromonas sp. MMG013]MBQ4861396.1 phytanoyl-CoA dioxygenase family protein [Pseudoalteromonas sp. MMG013]
MKSKIDNAHNTNYELDGFSLHPHSINPAVVADALTGTQQVLVGRYDTGIAPWSTPDVGNDNQVQRVQQIHLANYAIKALLTSPVIGQLAAQITGASCVQIVLSQLYYKPPNSGQGGEVGFHRDNDYISAFTSGVINAWLPLVDMCAAMAPLTYVNQSHCWPKKSRYSGIAQHNLHQQRQLLKIDSLPHPWIETPSITNAGDIAFHHPKTLHGSAENTTDTGRYAVSMCLITDKVTFNTNETRAREMLKDNTTYPIIYEK